MPIRSVSPKRTLTRYLDLQCAGGDSFTGAPRISGQSPGEQAPESGQKAVNGRNVLSDAPDRGDGKDGNRGQADELFGDRAEQEVGKAGPPVRSHDDEIVRALLE